METNRYINRYLDCDIIFMKSRFISLENFDKFQVEINVQNEKNGPR